MKIQRKASYSAEVDRVTVNSPFGGIFVKAHPEILEILASSPDGTFDITNVDRDYLEDVGKNRVAIPEKVSPDSLILSVGYLPKGDQWTYTKGNGIYLTWNQFVRNGRPMEIEVKEQIDLSRF